MFPRLIAGFVRNSFKSEQKKLGVSVEFSKLPKGFVQGLVSGNLTSVWRDQGLPVRGVGMFTVGLPTEDGFSTRYSLESPTYQAWFGCYIVDAPDDFIELDKGVPNLNNIFQLAIEDQNHWLKKCGDPNPVTFPLPGTENVQNDVPLQEGTCTMVEVKMKTHVDIGPVGKTSNIFLKTVRHLFSSEEPLPSQLLISPGSEEPFASLVLQGYAIITRDEESGVTAVGFACSTEKYFSSMRDELLDSLLSLKLVKNSD